MIEKTIARLEALLKGMVFDCRVCGQCVLKTTHYICPMACPKGLRNGPCGGTLQGECEVFPDRQCVWVRIQKRAGAFGPPLLSSPDARLFNTSSYLNFLSGKDKAGKEPVELLDLGRERVRQAVHTGSRLEARLKAGTFVKTCELRSPRTANFGVFDRHARMLKGHFDAVNATAFLSAKPSLPSAVAAARLAELGLEAICQATCRDHTKTSFVAELLQNQAGGVHNVLCLTGDYYTHVPRIKQVFDMDGALMLHEARHLREKGVVHFTGDRVANPPRPFLGAAINPYTEPNEVPVRRLRQKCAAGADFIQTQVVFDIEKFRGFMLRVREAELEKELFILAGVPVVTARASLSAIGHLPGVYLPEKVKQRLKQAGRIEVEGIRLAQETIEQVKEVPGVAGVHMMLFGPDHSVLPATLEMLDANVEIADERNRA